MGKMKFWGRRQTITYVVPVVPVIAIKRLRIQRLPESADWGVWNTDANDWVRDNNGYIESRISVKDVKKLLKLIQAKSILEETK